VMGLQQLTQTMAETVSSRPIAAAVIQQENLQMTPQAFLEDQLRVEQVKSTQLIEVKYRDPSPTSAQRIANSVGDTFSNQISETSAANGNTIAATVWERAEVPEEPVSPDLVRYLGIALVIGVMLGVGLAFLLEYLDDSWRSPQEAEQVSGVPTLGVIRDFATLMTNKKGRS
jgi:capsular polysaccharide biosynthesis protein